MLSFALLSFYFYLQIDNVDHNVYHCVVDHNDVSGCWIYHYLHIMCKPTTSVGIYSICEYLFLD